MRKNLNQFLMLLINNKVILNGRPIRVLVSILASKHRGRLLVRFGILSYSYSLPTHKPGLWQATSTKKKIFLLKILLLYNFLTIGHK